MKTDDNDTGIYCDIIYNGNLFFSSKDRILYEMPLKLHESEHLHFGDSKMFGDAATRTNASAGNSRRFIGDS